MIYKKKLNNFAKYQTKRLNINDFYENVNSDKNSFLLGDGEGVISYNIKNNFGELISNNGVRELLLCNRQSESDNYVKKLQYIEGKTFKKVWRYKYYSEFNKREEFILMFLDNSNVIYWAVMFGFDYFINTFDVFAFNEEPNAISFTVDGKSVIGFSSPSDELVVWYCDDEAYKVEGTTKFKSICLHNGRLFAIDTNKDYIVRYSSKTNPLDWSNSGDDSDAGEIELNDFKGSLEKIVSFADDVIVFREFGISKISSYSSSSKYAVSNVFDSSCKIYCNTVCVCGQDIFFLAGDGLYKFDGYNVKKINLSISKLIFQNAQDMANTCYFEGKLYIACNIAFSEENLSFSNNAIIVFDPETQLFDIIKGVDVLSMCAVKDLKMSKLIMCLNKDNGGKLWELCKPNQSEFEFSKYWQSGKVYFEKFDKDKILKEVIICAKSDVKLIVKTDSGNKEFLIKANDNLQRVRINLKSKIFEVVFQNIEDEFCLSTAQFIFAVRQ